MNPSCFLLSALFSLGSSLGTFPAAQGSPNAQRSPQDEWIVQFKQRSFDLRPFRAAVFRHDQQGLEQVIQKMEKRSAKDRQDFVHAIQSMGGKILKHWWIINACSIHLPSSLLSRLRQREDVLSISPNFFHTPSILSSTNAKNHNADSLQVRGIQGKGSSIAILDTGQDAQMARSGRPHRTYFVDGNLKNKSGKGIGGTRLLLNKQVGLTGPEDNLGHGTAVAAVAAGAKWGPIGSDHGHAYGAGIAGYSIADNSLGSAKSSTIISAWQEVAKDRLRLGITVANNSYSGSPNPLDPVQKALDSVALNADVLICVPAGNTGFSTLLSQGAANAIAVGAVEQGTHKLTPFSSRGPLYGDKNRTYPDLVACGLKLVTPKIDDENGVNIVSGTSMSAPQVAGAAALLRGSFPKLRADETKALLLASAQPLNAENPGLSRNGLGLGFLRDDIAYQATRNPSQHWRAKLSSTTPTLQYKLPVQKGRVYSIAISWFRTKLNSSSWSNLDLDILDGNNLVSSSHSPRNLYERVLFVAPKTGTYVIRVFGRFLAGGTQDFALAWSDRVPLRTVGTYSSFGQGCQGTGFGTIKATCLTRNGKGGTLNRSAILSPSKIFALQITAPNNLSVNGFELFTQYIAKIQIPTFLFLDNSGKPAKTPIRSSTMTVSTSAGFSVTNFTPPLSIPKGTRFYLGFKTPVLSLGFSAFLKSGSTTPYFWNSSSWSGPWKGVPFAWRIQCAVTQRGAIPRIQHSGSPEIGKTFGLLLDQVRPLSACVLFTGLSNTRYAGVPLPLDFGLFGANGCKLFVSGEFLYPFLSNSQGKAKIPIPIPPQKALIGTHFFQQVLVLDTPANNLGMVFSNAEKGTVGGWR